MPIRSLTFAAFIGALLLVFSGGCVMQRTVKEDGVVVEKGYVIKDPL